MTPKKKTQPEYRPASLNERITRRAVEILEGGAWYDTEALVRELMPMVLPGVAKRRNERDRRFNVAGRRGITAAEVAPRKRPAATDQMIRSGQRAIVRETLTGIGAFEVNGPKVRLVDLPRIVRGDRLRGEYLLPVLNGLAETFRAAGMEWCYEHVRGTAHDHGLHLASCPKGDRLDSPPPPGTGFTS